MSLGRSELRHDDCSIRTVLNSVLTCTMDTYNQSQSTRFSLQVDCFRITKFLRSLKAKKMMFRFKKAYGLVIYFDVKQMKWREFIYPAPCLITIIKSALVQYKKTRQIDIGRNFDSIVQRWPSLFPTHFWTTGIKNCSLNTGHQKRKAPCLQR